METLTKENFWNEMEQKYPKAMKHFNEWIDSYKKKNNWEILFNAGWYAGIATSYTKEGIPYNYFNKHQTPKYHELPIAMQFGIFIEYMHFSSYPYSDFFYTIRVITGNKDGSYRLLDWCTYHFPNLFKALEDRLP